MKQKAAFQLEKHGARVVYRLTWGEVRRILGRDHANTAADDAKLARALRAAGARPLGKSYAKEDGWHAFAPKGTPAPALAKRSNPAGPGLTSGADSAQVAFAAAQLGDVVREISAKKDAELARRERQHGNAFLEEDRAWSSGMTWAANIVLDHLAQLQSGRGVSAAIAKRSNPVEPPPTRRKARATAASAKAHKEADKIGESMRAAYKPKAAPDTRAEDLRKVQAALGTMRVQANAAGDDAKAAKAGADVAYFEGMADGASISGEFVADMLRATPGLGTAARARAALSSLAERVRGKSRPKARKRAKPSR